MRLLLKQVPAIEHLTIRHEQRSDEGPRPDLTVQFDVSGARHVLLCEVKSNAQPRHVRPALLQLREYAAQYPNGALPVLIAPYLSAAAQALCHEYDAGFLDLQGNVRLAFGTVFIDRQVATKPVAERRELRSVFKPKSARVVRLMLRKPSHPWRVAELAKAAAVSLGQVSNVRSRLLDREWAEVSRDGLSLSNPDALLDAWSEEYKPPAGERHRFYTALHGKALDETLRRTSPESVGGSIVLASFSAGQWLAPYGRTSTQYFYADDAGLERLRSRLMLAETSKGENVAVTVIEDSGLFRDSVEPAPGVICTSPVQTYLDLMAAGERGREAAAHLRREKLKWQK